MSLCCFFFFLQAGRKDLTRIFQGMSPTPLSFSLCAPEWRNVAVQHRVFICRASKSNTVSSTENSTQGNQWNGTTNSRSHWECKTRAKRSSQLEPTRAKFTTSMELGIVWPPTWLELARVGSTWLDLIKLKFSLNSSQVFHSLATSINSSQLSPSCFVIVLWLRGRLKTIKWFLASWLDLAVSFGHPPMHVFVNL